VSKLTIAVRGRSIVAIAASLLTVAVAGSLVAPLPAAAASGTAATEQQRDRVRWRAVSAAEWEVRAAARAALTDSRDTAVPNFIAVGLGQAERRADAFEATNISKLKHLMITSGGNSAVYLASKRALAASHDDKDEFFRNGLTEAQRQDAESAGQHQAEVAKQAQPDRDYVAELARTDPGAQVRSAARFATNSGRDEDIAEFFAYYWAAGAHLDKEAYGLRLADLDATGAASLERLHAAVVAAQAAEHAATGAAAEKLHVDTVAAWTALAESADGASIDWAAERDRAAAQEDAWRGVAEFAGTARTAQDWAGVIVRALNSGEAWTEAAKQATKQAADWLAIAQDARSNATGTPAPETESSL
jgi:hypothetical protein